MFQRHRSRPAPSIVLTLAVTLAGCPILAGATRAATPEGPDSMYVVDEPVVVSASKLPVPVADLASSVSLVSADELRRTPATTVPDVLARTTALHVYDFAGNDMVPTVESRGFAAQGETSHLRFLVDGVPFSDLAADHAVWNLLGSDQLDRVEVIRSSSSGLHGNTSFTGVVNLVTRTPEAPWSAWGRVGGGSFGRVDAVGGAGAVGERWRGNASIDYRETEGWRENSEWSGVSSAVTGRLALGDGLDARLGLFVHGADARLPGGLSQDELDEDREQASTPLDRDERTNVHAVLSLDGELGDTSPFRASVFLEDEARDIVRTLAFVPQLEERRATTVGAEAVVRVAIPDTPLPTTLMVGGETSLGRMDSDYFGVDDAGTKGDRSSAGEISRDSFGAFARLAVDPFPRVRLEAGLRYDYLSGELEPGADDPFGIESSSRDFDELSPSVSLNLRIPRGDGLFASGNAFVQWSRSFKAPTLALLYDVRVFDFGGGPFTLASGGLDPQLANQIEGGVRTRMADAVDLDLVAYWMEVEDEIGFNQAVFSYENLGESTHVGVEASAGAYLASWLRGELGYTWTKATFGSAYGSLDETIIDNQINNVPENLFRAGLDVEIGPGRVGVTVLRVQDQFADEANEIAIPDYTLVDLRAAARWQGQELFLTVRNLFDEEYAPVGYIDVDGARFFPGPGTRVEGGLRFTYD